MLVGITWPILLATFSDPQVTSTALCTVLFIKQFNPADIRNLRARQRLQQALEYVQNIQKLGLQRGGSMKVQISLNRQ